MKESASYPKVVQWSEEDRCYVGQCCGIIGPCCHGDDEHTVYFELCRIVDEWIDVMRRDGNLLPPSTIGLTPHRVAFSHSDVVSEDCALAKCMADSDGNEVLSLAQARKYYATLEKAK